MHGQSPAANKGFLCKAVLRDINIHAPVGVPKNDSSL